MSVRAKLAVFTVLFGFVVILFLGFIGIELPYVVRYLVFLVAIALYACIMAIFGILRKRRQ